MFAPLHYCWALLLKTCWAIVRCHALAQKCDAAKNRRPHFHHVCKSPISRECRVDAPQAQACDHFIFIFIIHTHDLWWAVWRCCVRAHKTTNNAIECTIFNAVTLSLYIPSSFVPFSVDIHSAADQRPQPFIIIFLHYKCIFLLGPHCTRDVWSGHDEVRNNTDTKRRREHDDEMQWAIGRGRRCGRHGRLLLFLTFNWPQLNHTRTILYHAVCVHLWIINAWFTIAIVHRQIH